MKRPLWIAIMGVAGMLSTGTTHSASDMPRLPPLAREQMTLEQQTLADNVLKVSGVGLGGPYNPMLRSPVMGQRMFDLLDYLRWKTSVPKRLNEFAILIVGRHWRSQVEWFSHGPIAAKAGLPQHVIDDLRVNKRPTAMQADEEVVYDFVTELLDRRKISDATYARTKATLGEQGVVDLAAVAGTYVTVAMLIAAADEHVPPGKDEPFKPGDP